MLLASARVLFSDRLARIKCNGFSGGQIEKGWKGREGAEDESLSDRVTERTVLIRALPGR